MFVVDIFVLIDCNIHENQRLNTLRIAAKAGREFGLDSEFVQPGQRVATQH
jgi:hypothetical protein